MAAAGDVDSPEAASVASGVLTIAAGADGFQSVVFGTTVSVNGGAVSPLQVVVLDGDGVASKFGLRLELVSGEVSIAAEIAETDPGE